MPRSKIFSLSKLRGRSRSVAKNRGRRLEDDGPEERTRTTRAPAPRPSPAPAAVPERGKSPAATAKAKRSARAGAVVSPPAPAARTERSEHRRVTHIRKSPTRTETAIAPPEAAPAAPAAAAAVAASAAPISNHGVNHSMDKNMDSSRDTCATSASECASDYNSDHFVTAFTRSPPSFDKFDSDILLSEAGVFPQLTTLGGLGAGAAHHPDSLDGSRDHSNNSYAYSSVGPSHSGSSARDDDSSRPGLALNGSYPGEYEPHGVGPHGILWGDSSVGNDAEEGSAHNNSAAHVVQECFSGSADPPAILMGLEDDDEDAEDGVGSPGVGVVDSLGSLVSPLEDDEKEQAPDRSKGEWFDSFTKSKWKDDEPKNKNRRLVSPSPVKASVKNVANDDFAAWGGVAVTGKSTQENGFQESDDVFGNDFFKSGGGFDGGNDGFGTVGDDAFFGNSWMDVNANRDSNSSKPKKGAASVTSDPWGGASFAETPSFNYSRSNEEADQGRPSFEEKKDDDGIGRRVAPEVLDPPEAAPRDRGSKVWDGQADGAPAALVTPSQAGRDAEASYELKQHHPLHKAAAQSAPQANRDPAASNQAKQHHPLLKAASPSSPEREKHEVVVTFDKSLTNHGHNGRSRPPSIINERKASHGSGAAPAAHRHRRLNSKESLSSHISQLSHSQPRRNKKGSAGSVGSSHSRRKKGGGSVGSNSSAVDQILEHYRQKRRNAKDKVGGRVTPSGAASVHSVGVPPGSASVHSGSQITTPGSSSGAGTSVVSGPASVVIRAGSPGSGPGSAVGGGSGHGGHARHHRRIPSGGSSSHRRIPSGSSSSHRRIPSGGSSSHRRTPSSESVSRIIDNLEATAAATGRGQAAMPRRSPSPAMGKYYPPSANGYVGGGNGDDAADHHFLLANIEATIGPRGVAPDMESLSGRSIRSQRSQSQPRPRPPNVTRHRSSSRPHRSPPRNHNRRISGDTSVDSRASKASRNSFRTYQSTRSALTAMSKETQSVANDLFRLEAQLAEVARQQEDDTNGATRKPPPAYPRGGEPSSNGTKNTLGADPIPRHASFQITAPPGKLGILLSNKSGQKGPTHVSAVRSESVLAGKVHVGDVFVSIDGEDVTRMNSKEITSIMARKAEFERVLRFRPLVQSPPPRQEWI